MKLFNYSLASAIFASLLTVSMPINATVVFFKTNLGDFEVNLLDKETPDTVANFLRYIDAGAYQNNIIHRSVSNFIVQGGGFNYNVDNGNVVDEMRFTTVKNEPVFSNVRGTIAMAKQGNDEDSATNQWFFNVANNSSNLDNQNGGFTVFGVVTGNGMEILDAINDLPLYNIEDLPAFTDTPLRAEPTGDGITDQHFVIIESITITDPNEDTQPVLPPKSTVKTDSDSSGGSHSLMMVIVLVAVRLFRRS